MRILILILGIKGESGREFNIYVRHLLFTTKKYLHIVMHKFSQL